MEKKLLGLFCFGLLSLSPSQGAVTRVYGFKRPLQYLEMPKIRVRVQRATQNILVSGVDLKRKIHLNNDVKEFEGPKRIHFNCRRLVPPRGNSPGRPILLASLLSPTGLISLKRENHNEKYKGLLHIVTSPKAKSCDVIHETDMAHYLSSLLSKEMNPTWPLEALKAQAVAARTYALYKMESRQVAREAGFETFYHLENSEKHQVGGHFFDSTRKTTKASNTTQGEILLGPSQKIKPIFFHAQCGGQTLRPDEVWQNSVEGHQTVPCPFCHHHKDSPYQTSISLSRFKKFLAWLGRKKLASLDPRPHLQRAIKIHSHQKFSRTLQISLGGQRVRFKKSLLRRYLGRQIIPSNNFQVALKGRIHFTGNGLGHGVGMCQVGALALASKGWNYKKILSYYFPQFKIKRLY